MPAKRVPLNTLEVAGINYLLAEGGGERVHLVREAESGDPLVVAALQDHHLIESPGRAAPGDADRDEVLLREPSWRPTTLCGIAWSVMTAAEWGRVFSWQNETYAPDCRSCLRIVSRTMTESLPDGRIVLLTELVTRAVVEYGSAQISGVPGDQSENLRAALRRAVKAKGYKIRTYMHETEVFAVSEDAYTAIPLEIRDQRDREVAERLGKILAGREPDRLETTGWRFSWNQWGTL